MKKVFLIAPAFFLLFACGGEGEESNEETTDTTEEVVETPEEEVIEEPAVEMTAEEEILGYLEEKGWEGEAHPSGLYVVTDEPGEGDERPTLMDNVTIYYAGYLLDGFKFDGTQEGQPATFPLNGLIQGWQIGIPMFGKGGKGKLLIPSDLAYGDRDNGDIPAGSTLMFEIELLDWAPQEM